MKNKLDAAGFEKEYPNVVKAAKEVELGIKEQNFHVIATAKVKSGKKILKECLSVRNSVDKHKAKDIIHFYITKLDRCDTNVQLKEMSENYGIKVFKIQNQQSIKTLVKETLTTLNNEQCIWVHFDESDFGTAEKQLIAQFFEKFNENDDIRFILYSATNEEAEFSDFAKYYPVRCVVMEPGVNYKGSKWYLDNNLVEQATSFWDFKNNELTEQGKQAMHSFSESDKYFSVVRFPNHKEYSKISQNIMSNHFTRAISVFDVEVRFVNSAKRFEWGKENEASWHGYVHNRKKVLLVICQTCTRSTEVGFHEYIDFWHDYRNGTDTPYNTRIQAYLRVAHYHSNGHKIKLYVDKPTLQLDCGLISYEEYSIKTSIPLSTRIISKILRKNYSIETIDFDKTKNLDEAQNFFTDLFGMKCTVSVCSQGNQNSYARFILNEQKRGYQKDLRRIFYLDGPSPNFISDWKELESKLPNLIGKFVWLEDLKLTNNDVAIHTKNRGNGSSMYVVQPKKKKSISIR